MVSFYSNKTGTAVPCVMQQTATCSTVQLILLHVTKSIPNLAFAESFSRFYESVTRRIQEQITCAWHSQI